MDKICKIHGIEYNYICPHCIKPFLIKTRFSNLEEIRDYQKEGARKVNVRRKPKKIDTIGLVKIKFSKDIAYSGFLLYDSI